MPGYLAAAALAATVWFLYGGITKLWWTQDDVFHLHFLLTHSPLAYCFSPEVWGSLPFTMFTPLQFLSYHLDLVCFGARPGGFYAHQLFVFWAAACALYAALRRWLQPQFAWAAASLFVLGAPAASWVIELALRHYIEGLFLAAFALAFFVDGLRQRRFAALAVSSLLYFLAMLEKEVYVPLIVFLLALPESTWRLRLRCLRLHFVALFLYLAWRCLMLGTLLGGYGWATRSREMPGLMASLPVKVGALLVGRSGAWSGLLLACLLGGVALLIWRRPRSSSVMAVSAILILGPIVPVAKSLNDRFAALPWLLFTVAFVFGCRELANGPRAARWAATAAILVAGGAALMTNRLDWTHRFSESQRASAEGRFYLSMQPGDLLRHPRIPPAALGEMRWLKEELLRLPAGSGWYADDVYLCEASRAPHRIWEYQEKGEQVRDVTAEALEEAGRYCSEIRDRPLRARFEYLSGAVFWELGPYESGTYSLVFGRGTESIAVRPNDGYRMKPSLLLLMVRYESPEGWVAYSPELTMDFRGASKFHWERAETRPE